MAHDYANILKCLIDTSPVPVIRGDVNGFILSNLSQFRPKYQKNLKRDCEQYSSPAAFISLSRGEAKRLSKPRHFIILDEDSLSLQVSHMLHETGHAIYRKKRCTICRKKCCECEKKQEWVSEYYAEKYALEYSLRENWKEVLMDFVNSRKWLADYGRDCHKEAAKKLMSTRLWKKACRRIGVFL